MRSLGELADECDRWAAENEAMASHIMRSVSDLGEHIRSEYLRQASILTDEAESLRHRAARLRGSAIERVAMLLRSQAQTAFTEADLR